MQSTSGRRRNTSNIKKEVKFHCKHIEVRVAGVEASWRPQPGEAESAFQSIIAAIQYTRHDMQAALPSAGQKSEKRVAVARLVLM